MTVDDTLADINWHIIPIYDVRNDIGDKTVSLRRPSNSGTTPHGVHRASRKKDIYQLGHQGQCYGNVVWTGTNSGTITDSPLRICQFHKGPEPNHPLLISLKGAQPITLKLCQEGWAFNTVSQMCEMTVTIEPDAGPIPREDIEIKSKNGISINGVAEFGGSSFENDQMLTGYINPITADPSGESFDYNGNQEILTFGSSDENWDYNTDMRWALEAVKSNTQVGGLIYWTNIEAFGHYTIPDHLIDWLNSIGASFTKDAEDLKENVGSYLIVSKKTDASTWELVYEDLKAPDKIDLDLESEDDLIVYQVPVEVSTHKVQTKVVAPEDTGPQIIKHQEPPTIQVLDSQEKGLIYAADLNDLKKKVDRQLMIWNAGVGISRSEVRQYFTEIEKSDQVEVNGLPKQFYPIIKPLEWKQMHKTIDNYLRKVLQLSSRYPDNDTSDEIWAYLDSNESKPNSISSYPDRDGPHADDLPQDKFVGYNPQRYDLITVDFYNSLASAYNLMIKMCVCNTDCDCNAVCSCNTDCGCNYSG